jgi:hypothetical protein
MKIFKTQYNLLKKNHKKNLERIGKKIEMSGREEAVSKILEEEAVEEVEVNEHFKFDIVIIKYINTIQKMKN